MELIQLPVTGKQPYHSAELWMTYLHPDQMVASPEQWTQARDGLDAWGFAINSLGWAPLEVLAGITDISHESGLCLTIECGYFDWITPIVDHQSCDNPHQLHDHPRTAWLGDWGADTAAMEMHKLERFFSTGAQPAVLNLDGPVRRMVRPGQDCNRTDIAGINDLSIITRAIGNYMLVWRERFPDIRFFWCVNFPNWGWKKDTSYWNDCLFNGDFYLVLEEVLRQLEDGGFPSFSGLTIDCPFEYYTGSHQVHQPWLQYPDSQPVREGESDPCRINWHQRLEDLIATARAQHLLVNLVVNSESGFESAETFTQGTFSYLEQIQTLSDYPDIITLQSWYPHPRRAVPETTPHTMCWLLREVSRHQS